MFDKASSVTVLGLERAAAAARKALFDEVEAGLDNQPDDHGYFLWNHNEMVKELAAAMIAGGCDRDVAYQCAERWLGVQQAAYDPILDEGLATGPGETDTPALWARRAAREAKELARLVQQPVVALARREAEVHGAPLPWTRERLNELRPRHSLPASAAGPKVVARRREHRRARRTRTPSRGDDPDEPDQLVAVSGAPGRAVDAAARDQSRVA